jgi:hypothetical protein
VAAVGADAEVVDAEWLVRAEAAVAVLRDEARRRPGDRGLHCAIGELMLHHPVFVTLWTQSSRSSAGTFHNRCHDAAE